MKIKEIIAKSVRGLGVDSEVVVERPGDESRGDFACNVAMVEARKSGENPRELAEEYVEKLKKDKSLELVVGKIEVAGPGFINFWIRDAYLSLSMVVESSDYDEWKSSLKGEKVLVEYSSPNIAKRFSVGHLRSTIIGQAIFNLYKACGASVTNDNHLGDWGTQFGMIIAAVEEEGLEVSNMSINDLEELYVRFNKRIVDHPELKDRAREAFARLEAGDQNARKIWQESIEVSMKEFGMIYEKLGVTFEHEYGESFFEKTMPEIIALAKQKGIASEGEKGAWIVKFEKEGNEYMSPAMLVKGDGSTTYFTRDLATILLRVSDPKLKSDMYVYEVGSEQTLHLRQVFEAARMLWPTETKDVRFVHVAHGLLTLPEGKMSTRKGNTIKLEDLINKAGDEARDYVKNGDIDFEKMALNSIKYNELKRSPTMNYVFRWDEALSMEGNSAPYINYAYVRAKKISEQMVSISNRGVVFEGDEVDLARWLARYVEGEIVEEATKNFAPQQLCAYLFEVAKRFNAFYDKNKVLGDPRENQRMVLVKKVVAILDAGMKILGIDMVERM